MKMKSLLSALLCACLSWAGAVYALTPISLNIYPQSVEIPYGATLAHTTLTPLTFYVVSNVAYAQNLSSFTLAPVTPGTPTTVVPGTPTVTCNNAQSSVLQPQGPTGFCTITVPITATGNQPGGGSLLQPINYQFSFQYGGTARMQTMTSPAFLISFGTGLATTNNRTFTFINKCSSTTVYLGISSGAAPSITPDPHITPVDPNSCQDTTNSSDCYPGSSCINVSTVPVTLNHCFWNNPVPTGGVGGSGYQLAPGNISTSQATAIFPMYDNGIDQVWSGGVAARIGCTSSPCTIADCGGTGTGACLQGTGFNTPNTTAEFTLQGVQALVTNTSGYPDGDTYDITVINGVTGGGLSMGPTAVVPTSSYVCSTPGGVSQAPTGFSAANWSPTPPVSTNLANGETAVRADYIWVTAPGLACPANACTGGTVCGHTITGAVVSPTTFCGTQLGVLTADAVCAIDPTFGAPFDCATPTFQQNGTTYNFADVYGCSVGDFKNSCYSAGASGFCCGCDNWDDILNAPYTATIPSTSTGLTKACVATNTNWTSIARKTLNWLKQAIPSAYVFPYDDASSTFTCQVLNPSNVNQVNYTITFCPS